MRLRFTFALLVYLFVQNAAHSEELIYRWKRGKNTCVSLDGTRGYNRDSVGECGQLPKADFSDQDLSQKNFRGADLRRANFSGANLSGTDFAGADLSKANLFGGAVLEGAIYSKETLLPFPVAIASMLGMKELSWEKLDNSLKEAVSKRLDGKTQDDTAILDLLERQAHPQAAHDSLEYLLKQRLHGTVRLLVKYGFDLNVVIRSLQPLLHTLDFGSIESVRLLLELGANPNFKYEGRPALSYYLLRNSYHQTVDLQKVEALLHAGADVRVLDERCASALHYAPPSVELVKLLLDHGASVHAPVSCVPRFAADSVYSVLGHWGVEGNVALTREAVEVLIQHGANVNETYLDRKDGVRRTLLTGLVSAKSDVGAANLGLLIDLGADIEMLDGEGVSPAYRFIVKDYSSSVGVAAMFHALRAHGADFNRLSAAGRTPLQEAILRRPDYGDRAKAESIFVKLKLLQDSGLFVDTPDAQGWTLLFYYAQVSDPWHLDRDYGPRIVKLLGNLDPRDSLGRTPLMVHLSNWLIEMGSDVNARDFSGKPVLGHYLERPGEGAADRNELYTAFERGADPNAVYGDDGRTPALSYIGRRDAQLSAVEVLLERIDVRIKDKAGRGVLDYALQGGNPEIIEAVKQAVRAKLAAT